MVAKVVLVAAFAIGTTICGNAKGDEKSKSYNSSFPQGFEVSVVDVCVTIYNEKEPGADEQTKKGLSSLEGIKLKKGRPGVIGSVSVDPRVIPYGSLVIIRDRGEEILCVAEDTGGAVKKRKASKLRAKKEGLGNEFAERPVLDIFSDKDHSEWLSVVVIKDNSLRNLSVPVLIKRLKERKYAEYSPRTIADVLLASMPGKTTLLARR